MTDHHHGAFGQDRFGQSAERLARYFGTPRYIASQTIAVIAWIALNVVGIVGAWDPYPFILLNLAFSTQAAYAAPLILLAQTRQADRDKILSDRQRQHADETHDLVRTIHDRVCGDLEAVRADIHRLADLPPGTEARQLANHLAETITGPARRLPG